MSESNLRLALPVDRFPVSRLNGPGLRWVIWVQGCNLRCTKRCLNPEYLDPVGGHLVAVDDAAAELDRVRGRYPELEGVTFLGGEPFDQAPALAALARAAHARGLSVVTYTGWVYEVLGRRGPDGSSELLAHTDLLIDGPFVEARQSLGLLWRGSANQRVLRLSDRYTAAEIGEQPIVKGMEVSFFDDQIHLSGAQDPELLRNVLGRLRGAGLIVRPDEGG